MRPITIQKPRNRIRGSWIATVQIRGDRYDLPVLHLNEFDAAGHYDAMGKIAGNLDWQRGAKYEQLLDAITNVENRNLVIVQKTKIEADGARSNAGYVGVFETHNIELGEKGFSLDRGKMVARFSGT